MPDLSKCSILDLLKASPWPLTVTDIATTLRVDETTAIDVLRLLRQNGRATVNGSGWIIV